MHDIITVVLSGTIVFIVSKHITKKNQQVTVIGSNVSIIFTLFHNTIIIWFFKL